LASTFVPGIEPTAGLAMGMAAGATVTRLPVTSILIVVLLLGDAAIQLMPVVIIAAVTALVIDEGLTSRRPKPDDAVEATPPGHP
jgi:H+/Cl- antiporter ClcA